MDIRLKRAYDDPADNDGYRVLVDRVWPRGVCRDELKLDEWLKEVAPSDELRKWFGHEEEKWKEFRWRYIRELEEKQEELVPLLERLHAEKRVTLVFGSSDEEHNNAAVLKDYLKDRLHQS